MLKNVNMIQLSSKNNPSHFDDGRITNKRNWEVSELAPQTQTCRFWNHIINMYQTYYKDYLIFQIIIIFAYNTKCFLPDTPILGLLKALVVKEHQGTTQLQLQVLKLHQTKITILCVQILKKSFILSHHSTQNYIHWSRLLESFNIYNFDLETPLLVSCAKHKNMGN